MFEIDVSWSDFRVYPVLTKVLRE